MTTKRTEAASKARHLNALRRKAPAMVEALRELGYGVYEPEVAPTVSALITEHIGDDSADERSPESMEYYAEEDRRMGERS